MEGRDGRIQRVSGRKYNQYLKRKDPMCYAPTSSKRHIASSSVEAVAQALNPSTATNSTTQIEETTDVDGTIHIEDQMTEQLNTSTGPDVHINSVPEIDLDTETEEIPHWILEPELPHENESMSESDKMFDEYQENHENVFPVDNSLEAELDHSYMDTVQHEMEGDQPVFPGSRLKLGASMLLIMTFALKYSLTGEGLSDLLTLISLHCPIDNLLLQSVGSFKKWFQNIKHPLKIHKYCSKCNLIISDIDLRNTVCPNPHCGMTISESSISHFIELPITEQIKSFFERPSFASDIQERFRRKKKSAHSIEDIYDGQVYQALSQPGGMLDNPYNLSLLWNTDGIPCFKSSNMSLWPLFFQINELPYSKRSCPENMILGGLWFGPNKPTMMSYTEPFINTLRQLESQGVEINVNGSVITSKVIVIGGSADLPAKSVVCNTIQFNGKFGCFKCLQPGETCKTGARGHVHVFPFKQDSPDGPKRTHQEHLNDVKQAVVNNRAFQGVKGPSFLQCLSFYNVISGTCIDYMHGVLLGVTKLLLRLWFSSEYSGEPFSLYASVDVIDRRLKWIKPPNNITRLPRSIKDHLKYWKASELRSWLLYYSLPVLRDIQTHDYFQHYLLFVNAIYLLLQESITAADLEQSHALLMHFCCLFTALYGDRYMTCNVHQLLHLSDMVRDMGPLWSYSCFSFENANGNLLKLFNGTQNVDFQIIEAINLTQNLPFLQKHFLKAGSPEVYLYEKMKGQVKRNDTHLFDHVYAVGGIHKGVLNRSEMNAVAQFLGYVPDKYQTFNRIRIGGEIFHSKRYLRVQSRNSFTVAYKTSEGEVQFCQIVFYLKLFCYCEKHGVLSNKCGCTVKYVACANPFTKVTDSSLSEDELTKADVSFISILRKTESWDQNVVIPLQNILYKCVFVEIKDNADFFYACKMPNSVEKD